MTQQRLFDALMDLLERGLGELDAHGLLRPGTDPTWRAFTAAFIVLGPILVTEQIEARLDEDAFAPHNVRDRSACSLDILTHGLFRAAASNRDSDRTSGAGR